MFVDQGMYVCFLIRSQDLNISLGDWEPSCLDQFVEVELIVLARFVGQIDVRINNAGPSLSPEGQGKESTKEEEKQEGRIGSRWCFYRRQEWIQPLRSRWLAGQTPERKE